MSVRPSAFSTPGMCRCCVTDSSAVNRGTLARLLTNQAERARSEGHLERALTLYERMTVVDPGSTALWWCRAALEKEFGRGDAARASLRAILETTRDPEVRARVMREMAAEG